jgi:ABC-type glycerol-3-phosphate transport system substrate-binding protein
MAYSGTPIGREKATQIEGWSYFIPATSQKPELAWLFIQWAMGQEPQVAQMLNGGASAVRATYDDSEVQELTYSATALYLKSGEAIDIRELGEEDGAGVPARYVEAENPATGDTDVTRVPKPTFPQQEEMVEILVLAVNRAMSGEVSPQEALDQAQAEIEALLGD